MKRGKVPTDLMEELNKEITYEHGFKDPEDQKEAKVHRKSNIPDLFDAVSIAAFKKIEESK